MSAESANDLLSDLNEPQRAAVLHRDGPLLVLAGPGSGKTRVITRRAGQLVRSGVAPRNILAITFTNKAAEEMRRRIAELGVGRGMWVYTFHALGVRLIREFGALAGVEPGFSIYDEADQTRCAGEALAACGIAPELLRPDALLYRIGRAKNALQQPRDLLLQSDSPEQRRLGRLYEAYENILRGRNALDFDDLLLRVALVLQQQPELTERLNIRFQYLLIDEYQDTNQPQYVIARELSRVHGNICVTGDPDQSIYGWRGANLDNILNFERDHPTATVVRLEENYRSHGAILAAAGALIAHNHRRKSKRLWSALPGGAPVDVWQFGDDRAEAEHVAAEIRGLATEFGYGDMAILYRTNAVSRALEDALRARGVPYRMLRGVAFYARREIKDAVAYLRVLVNPRDDVALLRILNTPPRGIGKTTIQRVVSLAAQRGAALIDILRDAGAHAALKGAATKLQKFIVLLDGLAQSAQAESVSALVAQVLERTGLERALRREQRSDPADEDRAANVGELVTAARLYEEEAADSPGLIDFLQRISLVSDQDGVDTSAGAVQLMTLHTAKGLEFPVVFIVGLEQGLLPHERALRADGAAEIEEERRLCFVGMTRAMRRLILTHARQRLLRGVVMPRTASAFLLELPAEAVRAQSFAPAASSFAAQALAREYPAPAGGPGATSRSRRLRSAGGADDEPVFSLDDPVGRRRAGVAIDGRFADWAVGTAVRHAVYGVGEIAWIRPSTGSTRAGIRFGQGDERTFVLNGAPIVRLEDQE